MSNQQQFQILLVEDSPTSAELANYWLEDGLKKPFFLHKATTLASAVEILRHGHVDLTILDLNLPDSFGIETFLSIHSESNGVPVVVLSSDADEELAVEAVRQGAQDYVVKSNGQSNPLARPVRFAWERVRRHRAEESLHETEQQLYVARSLQQYLMPDIAPAVPGFDIAGHCEPAELIGGDYYDFIPLRDDTWGLAIADVSGHGIAAAMMSVEVRAVLRSLVRQGLSLAEMFTIGNEIIAPDLDQRFVTAFLAVLRPETRTLRYVSAAHPSLLLRADGTEQKLTAMTPPLGIYEGQTDVSDEIVMREGDLLVMYTDGIVERFNPRDEMFGLARFVTVLRENRERPAAEIMESVFQAVRDFSEGLAQGDDETLVIVKAVR